MLQLLSELISVQQNCHFNCWSFQTYIVTVTTVTTTTVTTVTRHSVNNVKPDGLLAGLPLPTLHIIHKHPTQVIKVTYQIKLKLVQ